MKFLAVGLLVASCVLSGGCPGIPTSPDDFVHVGPDPLPNSGFQGVGHVNGDFDFQTYLFKVPTSALVKGHGNATITVRAFPAPFLVIDGDGNVIVEPLPGKDDEAMKAVRLGHVLIRRNGITGDLNPVGSIDGFKAAKSTETSTETPPPPPPPAFPPTEGTGPENPPAPEGPMSGTSSAKEIPSER